MQFLEDWLNVIQCGHSTDVGGTCWKTFVDFANWLHLLISVFRVPLPESSMGDSSICFVCVDGRIYHFIVYSAF